MVQSSSNHLLFRLHNPHKFEQGILLVIMLLDGEVSEVFNFGAVLGAAGFLDSADCVHFAVLGIVAAANSG
ncbi:hypothetical protein ACFX10_038128 [Malus domestica]